MILMAVLFLMMISLMKGRLNVVIFIIMGFPIIYGSIIISAFLNSRKRLIEINKGIISIDNSVFIDIEQIKSCQIGNSFLVDGLMIKMKNHKTYYFHALTFFVKNPNLELFKNILFSKSVDNHIIPVKIKQDVLRESKFLRYGSTILLIFIIGLIFSSFFIDIKIDKIKLFYISSIALGTFISTRK
jgi:hypothetical protein